MRRGTDSEGGGRGLTERQISRLVALTVAVAIVALSAAAAVHQGCFEATPFEPPVAGTPRAGYCDAINAAHPWLSLTIVPVLAMLGGGYLLRRRAWWVYLLAALLCAAVVGNALVANKLEYEPFNV
jgi:1,4-dihydroxy-2-naphthoate octaprenyltransferase